MLGPSHFLQSCLSPAEYIITYNSCAAPRNFCTNVFRSDTLVIYFPLFCVSVYLYHIFVFYVYPLLALHELCTITYFRRKKFGLVKRSISLNLKRLSFLTLQVVLPVLGPSHFLQSCLSQAEYIITYNSCPAPHDFLH